MNNNTQLYSNNKLLNIIEYVFAFLTIIENSIFISSGKIGFIVKISWTFCLIILSLFAFLHLNYHNLDKLITFFVLFISGILLFLICNYFIEPFNRKFIFLIFIAPVLLIIYFSYCLQLDNNIPSLFYKFENIMLFISAFSLIFWFLSLIGMKPNMSIMSRFGANFDGTAVIRSIPGYFGLYFVPQGMTQFLGMNFIRNASIFNEAPIYSAMLNITLFIELFLRTNNKVLNSRIVLLIITLITTTSTNGILIALPAILLYLYLYLDSSKIKNIIFMLIPIILPFLIFIIKIIMTEKVNTAFNSSYSLRMDDTFAALTAWKQHLFIGDGLGNMMSIIQYMQPWRWTAPGGTGISPGLTTELAYGGIILICVYLLPMILASRKSKRLLALSICLILLFILEDISSYYIFVMIESYLYVYFLFYNYHIS